MNIEPIEHDLTNLNPGDKVVIRSDLIDDKRYGDETFYVDGMNEMCGKVGTVKHTCILTDRKVFSIEESNWAWTAEMCEGKIIDDQPAEEKELMEYYIISAKKARDLQEETSGLKTLLMFINDRIESAAKRGKVNMIFTKECDAMIKHSDRIIEILTKKGYEVEEIPASHYYEHGAFYVEW